MGSATVGLGVPAEEAVTSTNQGAGVRVGDKSTPMRTGDYLQTAVFRSHGVDGEGELHSENLQFIGVSKSEGYGADGLDDDNTFAKWTPSLDLRMCVNNPALHEMFKAGDVFYLNFVKAK